jgi:hypothetical protein
MEEEVIKRTIVYGELEARLKKLEKENQKLKKDKEKYTRKRKNYYEISKISKFNFRKELLQYLNLPNQLTNSVGLKIKKVVCVSNKTTTEDKIDLVIGKKYVEENNILSKALYLKDQNNVADKTWQKFNTQLNCNLPSLRQIRKKKKSLHSQIQIKDIENGFNCNIKIKLTLIVKKLIQKNMIRIINDIIIVKIAGDSTNIYRGNKTLVVSFSIINEFRCNTASGTYIVGIFRVEKEDYDELQKCLKEIKQDFYSLDSIEIESKNDKKKTIYKIEKFLGGDWKFLQTVLGITAANSNFFCLCCEAKRHHVDQYNYESVLYSLTEKYGNNRTIEKARKVIERRINKNMNKGKKQNKEEEEFFGYKFIPIFDFIEFAKVIPDLMHLFNRISGKLCNLFFKKLKEHDLRKTEYTDAFIIFLTENCDIHQPLKDIKDNEEYLKDFTGQKYWNIAKNVNLLFEKFKNLNRIDEIMQIWTRFYEIYVLIKYDQVTAIRIKELTLEWLGNFLKVYSNEDVTPYIHMFVFHLYELKELYAGLSFTINDFNLEGLEKKNDIVTNQYFHSSNRAPLECLKQILLKNNRLDFLYFESV